MKKIGLICLALVLALGALGVGAALWMGVLVIHGEVNTGNVDAIWSIEGVYDDEPIEKDFSEVTVEQPEPFLLEITINNAYPSVTYTVLWNIVCTGSVPIHFDVPMIMWQLPVEDPPLPEPGEITFTDMAGDPIPWLTVQLHPGDEPILGKLTVHLNNDAEQNAQYMFDIVLPYGQYNEFPPPLP